MEAVHNDTRLYKSIDGGDNWQLIIRDEMDGEVKLIIHPLNPELLIFFIGQKSYWLSEDGGESWEKTLQPLILSHIDFPPEVLFDPNDLDGLFWLKEGIVHHSIDRGETWKKVDRGLEEAGNGSLVASFREVFYSSSRGVYRLSEKTEFSQAADCLFQWAEEEYPMSFSPGSGHSHQWEGYIYKYYAKSNTYLGFLYEQEIHINWADVSSKINVVGS